MANDWPVRTAARALPALLVRERRLIGGIFLVMLALVVLATVASVLATAALGFIGFVPIVGLAVLPLQLLAWLARGLLFQFLGLAALGAYAGVVRGRDGTMTYERFFSHAAEQMRESAIRKMGTLGTRIPDLISFAPGYPDPATFPWEQFRAIAASLLSGADGSALQYGPTRGFRPLVEALETILVPRGIASTFEQRVITSGSQQGLDLVAKVLIDPGDTVLVELPTYTGAISAFRNALADLVGVPQEDDGIDLTALDRHGEAAARGRDGACACCIWCRTSRTPPGCSSGSTSAARCSSGPSAPTSSSSRTTRTATCTFPTRRRPRKRGPSRPTTTRAG